MNQNKKQYNEFVDEVSEGVLCELGAEFETRRITNQRNNGVIRQGITIRKKEESIAPAIYLDDFYREYRNGKCVSDIVKQLVYYVSEGWTDESREKIRCISLIPEEIKDKIIFRIINYERNEERLRELPHIRFLDLAITFPVLVYKEDGGIGTIMLTNEYFQSCVEAFWGKNIQNPLSKLYMLARENMQRLFPPHFFSLDTVLKSLADNIGISETLFPVQDSLEENMLYVLTNEAGLSGAGSILYEGMFEKLCEQIGTEFYLLPSSIHEVILMPAKENIQPEELNAMIYEINRTQVPEEEVLADHAYYSDEIKQVIQALQ